MQPADKALLEASLAAPTPFMPRCKQRAISTGSGQHRERPSICTPYNSALPRAGSMSVSACSEQGPRAGAPRLGRWPQLGSEAAAAAAAAVVPPLANASCRPASLHRSTTPCRVGRSALTRLRRCDATEGKCLLQQAALTCRCSGCAAVPSAVAPPVPAKCAAFCLPMQAAFYDYEEKEAAVSNQPHGTVWA